jgi:hypothetical protein
MALQAAVGKDGPNGSWRFGGPNWHGETTHGQAQNHLKAIAHANEFPAPHFLDKKSATRADFRRYHCLGCRVWASSPQRFSMQAAVAAQAVRVDNGHVAIEDGCDGSALATFSGANRATMTRQAARQKTDTLNGFGMAFSRAAGYRFGVGKEGERGKCTLFISAAS